ncbi:Proteasome assembly chaperone 2 [Spathaspora sp. JA1]|nr:Proteasome assembly chaperone 2 [Spathaspora sp. JA1]
MSFTPTQNNQPNLGSATLVIPSISIGNIPQLTIDLLIHTFPFVKIGYLDDLYVYPFASPVDYSKGPIKGISRAIEVYYCQDAQLCLIQQRSPILASFTDSFVKETILPFINQFKFGKVVVLDSSDAGLVEHVHAGGIEVYTTEELLSKSLELLKLSHEKLQEEQEQGQSNYVKSLLRLFNLPRNVGEHGVVGDVCVLVSFVYEGDNFYDAEKLASKLSQVLKLKQVDHWVRPVSWFGVYGDKPVPNAVEEGLFG